MAKSVLVSGIQPTNRLHLGNYLGVLRNFVELQNSGKYRCLFFVADYHSLTSDLKSETKKQDIFNLVTDYLAAGIDPKKSVIFLQSAVSAHTELAWILSALTPFGELTRMTQFKEKSVSFGGRAGGVNVGLFYYPVLMTADILIYNAKYVPVGEDQLQHLELARELARRFNKNFGRTFAEPHPLLTESSRIMSLDDPSRKMSKSRPAGCIFLDDSEEEIKRKIKRAVTDSGNEVKYDPKGKKAISNLIIIYSSLAGESIKETEKKFYQRGYDYFKKELAKVVIESLKSFREKQRSRKELEEILKSGNKKANLIASKKLEEVKRKIGIKI